MSENDSEPVPKLPRGRGLKFSGPEVFRIGFTLVTLIGIIVLTRPCANAVSNFVTGVGSGSAQKMPTPNSVAPPVGEGSDGSAAGSASAANPGDYEVLKPGMSEAEIKAAIERARARSSGSGGSSGSAGSSAGSASP